MRPEEKILQILRERVLPQEVVHQADIYLSRRRQEQAAVATWTGSIEAPAAFRGKPDVWVAYIDHMPKANFEHPVTYAYLDPDTGEVATIDAATPPNDLEENFEKLELPPG